jgi:tRNA dimethylallyltransferase
MHKIKYDLITILGPTACGKTKFAATLSAVINGEIISADSRQVYRRMNLGTGKDYDDYTVDGKKIPYHLVDIMEPGEKYNVYEFQKQFIQAYREIRARNKMPVLCGGSGMYIDAVTRGYRLLPVPRNNELRKKLQSRSLRELSEILSAYKNLHNITDTDTRQRAIRAIEIEDYYKSNPLPQHKYPEIANIFIGIKTDVNTRRERISRRLHERLDRGMVTEVENLLKEGLAPADLVYYGLEYKYITLYITGELDYDTMVDKLNTAIRQFAKRQMTWFRKMEREGARIHWLDSSMPMQEKIRRTMALLDAW